MKRRMIAVGLATAFLACLAVAVPQDKPPAKKTESAVICKLTGKKMDKCCCEPREGKLYCPLAKKEIEKCCCESSKAAKSKQADKTTPQ